MDVRGTLYLGMSVYTLVLQCLIVHDKTRDVYDYQGYQDLWLVMYNVYIVIMIILWPLLIIFYLNYLPAAMFSLLPNLIGIR